LVFDAYRNTARPQFQNGFPAHPHRGFLELRYITDGPGLFHNDSCGNRGWTRAGGIQALFTGRGIIHEEIPLNSATHGTRRGMISCAEDACAEDALSALETDGLAGADPNRFFGFQIWVNVPNRNKTMPPRYQNFHLFPTVHLQNAKVKVFAGAFNGVESAAVTYGPVTAFHDRLLFIEVTLKPTRSASFEIPIDPAQHALVYVIKGVLGIGDPNHRSDVDAVFDGQLAVLNPGKRLFGTAVPNESGAVEGATFLLLSAPKVREQTFVGSGFVAGSRGDLDRAMEDLRNGQSSHC
jgi:redox-sensitive bicupin YhaK (pirin superfamily)